MANDFYMDEDNQQEQSLMEQEFHEWQVFNDVVALVATQGLQSVMKTILNMMDERGIK
jgi:hypothetical protein|tara:strand:- start:177 stop:350 length:174 start_codon:yes stop_codon:yes gene_type:complete